MNFNKNFKGVTRHGLISGFYFKSILRSIIKMGDLKNINLNVLDFGCGYGYLKKILNTNNIVNYDIISELSEIKDWRNTDFDIFIANQVFYSFNKIDLVNLLSEIKSINPNATLIVGISRQGILNNIGKLFLGYKDAHKGTLLKPKDEKKILFSKMKLIEKKNIFFLMDLYKLRFKNK